MKEMTPDMRILWHNIFALILAAVAVAVLIRCRTALATFLGSLSDIGPGHPLHQQILGLIAFVICSVLFLVVLRSLINNRKR